VIAPTEIEDEYVAVAAQAVRASGGAAALDALGWWDLLAHLDEPGSRAAVFALFRAQGRELAGSAALGGLLAQPYVACTGHAPGTVVSTVWRRSPRRGVVHIAVGDVNGRKLLIDHPGRGAAVVDLDAVELRAIDVPGRLALHEVGVDWSDADTALTEAEAGTARRRRDFLGRLAIASEILGAAEAAVALAIDHAVVREQFGQAIGRFQAVRHLLAWARTDCVAVDAVAGKAVALDDAAPPRFDEVVKAMAGRNGQRACQRALQVLGGIGFTAEHDHHHHHGRVLALDSLLGTSATLTHDLGTWLRTEGSDPGFTTAMLGLAG
jgi:hypothetical protein